MSLPQEIVERLIDVLSNDRKGLINCCLVCKAWLRRSQHWLSTTETIILGKGNYKDFSQLASSDAARYIQRLDISRLSDNTSLENVYRSIQTCGAFLADLTISQRALLQLPSGALPFLSRLWLHDDTSKFDIKLLPIIASFVGLTEFGLTMDHDMVRSSVPGPGATGLTQADREVISTFKAPLGLQKVFFSSHAPWKFLPWFSSQQQSFKLTSASIRVSGYMFPLALQLYQNFLNQHDATLEELTILIANSPPSSTPEHGVPFDLVQFSALRKLTLVNFVDTNPALVFSDMLAQTPSCLETIHLCTRRPPDSQFNQLAAYMGRNRLPALHQLILSPAYTISFKHHGMDMSLFAIKEIVVEVKRLHYMLELQEGHGIYSDSRRHFDTAPLTVERHPYWPPEKTSDEKEPGNKVSATRETI